MSRGFRARQCGTRWNATHIPEHGARKAVALHVLGLERGDVRGIVRDELLLRGIIRVARDVRQVLVDGGTCERQGVVRVDASLSRAGADLCRASREDTSISRQYRNIAV